MPSDPHDPRMGTNERRLDMLEKGARYAVSEAAERHARRIVAGHPWLTFVCPACRQIGGIDLRRLDRHHGATIESLILFLSLQTCRSVAGDVSQPRRS
jgi:hypothetical protein